MSSSSKGESQTYRDSRGVCRGRCKECITCDGYQPKESGNRRSFPCLSCDCPPARHVKIDPENDEVTAITARAAGLSINGNGHMKQLIYPPCKLCENEVHFDLNKGEIFDFCKLHLDHQQVQGLPVPPSQGTKPPEQCAIPECTNARHVDDSGTVHECCGFTHAMELIRRKAIQKTSMVKGVTHCLLPNCNELTWPFMNYCSKKHAQKGMKEGLVPPSQPAPAAKDSKLCELPECQRLKFTDKDGNTFNFCGNTHAKEASKRGIVATTSAGVKTSGMCALEGCFKPKHKESDGTVHDYCSKSHSESAKTYNTSGQSVPKDDTMCIIPECTRPKYKDPETGDEFDFCGRSHAVEGRERGIQSTLTSRPNVDKFLKQFSGSLNVVNLEENTHAKPGGVLYKKFIAARDRLQPAERRTCLAFHGTAEANIQSICANGYDPGRRSGQAYGAGEYFATTPNTPLGYCSGGRKLLLNELLLGQAGTHHTKHGDVIVMKNPEHDLPRFIITFQ